MARSDERNTGNKPPRGPALQYANASSYRIEPFETVDSDERAAVPNETRPVSIALDHYNNFTYPMLWRVREALAAQGLHVVSDAERDELVQLRDRVAMALNECVAGQADGKHRLGRLVAVERILRGPK